MSSQARSEVELGQDLAEPREQPSASGTQADKSPPLPHSAIIAVAALATAACGGDGAAPPTGGSAGGAPPVQQVRKPTSDAQAARFLLQADFAASTAGISQLKD